MEGSSVGETTRGRIEGGQSHKGPEEHYSEVIKLRHHMSIYEILLCH